MHKNLISYDENAHIGAYVMILGREEEIRNKGLAASMSMNNKREIKTCEMYCLIRKYHL